MENSSANPSSQTNDFTTQPTPTIVNNEPVSDNSFASKVVLPDGTDGSHSSSKLVVIIGVVILLLALVGGGYYYMTTQNTPTPTTPTVSTATPTPAPKVTNEFVLTLTSPTDGELAATKALTIKGKTKPNVTVALYTDTDQTFVESDAAGNFEGMVNLTTGINSLTVTAFDDQGNEKSVSLNVVYDA